MTQPARPCRYCVANWTGMHNRQPIPGMEPILPAAEDCEWEHRDDPRVYALAAAFAKAIHGTEPTDEQTAWFLADANEVVDDFNPAPGAWRVRRLPGRKNDGAEGIEVRLRINHVTYVALEGGKGSRGSVVKLSTFREWGRS